MVLCEHVHDCEAATLHYLMAAAWVPPLHPSALLLIDWSVCLSVCLGLCVQEDALRLIGKHGRQDLIQTHVLVCVVTPCALTCCAHCHVAA